MRALATWLVLVGLAASRLGAGPAPAPAPPVDGQAIDATKLGVDLSRIQKGLRVAEIAGETGRATACASSFQVQVYGQAPKIEVLEGHRSVQWRRARHGAEPSTR